jgi:hypothetical protein
MADRRTDLSSLPPSVASAARIHGNGEVEWPRKVAADAIRALGDAGFLVLGLDLRQYPDGRTLEAPWFDIERAPEVDWPPDDDPALWPVRCADAAIEALARADASADWDDLDWVLVTW